MLDIRRVCFKEVNFKLKRSDAECPSVGVRGEGCGVLM